MMPNSGSKPGCSKAAQGTEIKVSFVASVEFNEESLPIKMRMNRVRGGLPSMFKVTSAICIVFLQNRCYHNFFHPIRSATLKHQPESINRWRGAKSGIETASEGSISQLNRSKMSTTDKLKALP